MHSFEIDENRFRKQIRFSPIGNAGQESLRRGRVAIVGVGALGSTLAERLVRAGVGFVRLIDRDWVEWDNLPRQALFTEQDARERTPKAIAAQAHLKSIDSSMVIESIVEDLTYRNAMQWLGDVDVICDGTDNFETRFLINDLSLEKRLPWVHGGCVAASGQVMVIVPGVTACFRCLIPDVPAAGSTETCDSAGVLGSAVSSIASWQATETIKLLCGVRDGMQQSLLCFDFWNGDVRKIRLDPAKVSPSCPACNGDRSFLRGQSHSTTTTLCGRDSVQVQPAVRQVIDLPSMAAKLQGFGEVISNPYFVRAAGSERVLTVFRDGRVVVGGTTDQAQARALVAQWIGS